MREAKWLVEEGHDVTIHAFDRLEELPREELVNGVRITRHRVGITPYGGTISTILGLRRFRNSVQKSLGTIDLLHCHDADTLPLLQHAKSATLFDMHDLHHTWALMTKPHSLWRRFASKWLKRKMLKQAKHADAIITSSSGFVKWLKNRGLPSVSIENRPDNQASISVPREPSIGYFGRIRESASFILLRDALLTLPDENRPSVLIAGDGTHYDEIESLFRNTPNIKSTFRGPFQHSELPEMMLEIGLMFAMYSPDRGNISDGALPSKMFEAAAFGRPSIVNQGTLMGQICDNENLGSSVLWGDTEGLATAIVQSIGKSVDFLIDASRERARFLDVVRPLLKD